MAIEMVEQFLKIYLAIQPALQKFLWSPLAVAFYTYVKKPSNVKTAM
jgi:hypothetical protein